MDETARHNPDGIVESDIRRALDHCTEKQGPHGCVRVQVINGEMYLSEGIPAFQTRTAANLLLIRDALRGMPDGTVPDFEFVLSLYDIIEATREDIRGVWHLDRRLDAPQAFLIPDFVTTGWPEAHFAPLQEVRKTAAQQAGPWKDKIDKIAFRGVAGFNPVRQVRLFFRRY